jgi:hypothetical protein
MQISACKGANYRYSGFTQGAMQMEPYLQISQTLHRLSEAEQLSIMVALIQGGPEAGYRSDAFIDALIPVDLALSAAYAELDSVSGG